LGRFAPEAAFQTLYDGNLNGHPSASEADAALCTMLAFWLGRDPDRIDRAFRRSGLMRDKWDSPRGDSTYGAQTVAAAVELQKETYASPQARTVDDTSARAMEPRANEAHVASSLTSFEE
jgi:putative DNA primase/helicase